MDQLPVAFKFVSAFAVVIALIMASAWAVRRLSGAARRDAAGAAPTYTATEPPANPNWGLIGASVGITHLLVLVFASKPDISGGFKVAVAIVSAAGLMLILRRAFARS